MTNTLRVKPLSEVLVKSHVVEDDKILILDSSTNEARLADKLEIKWDKWETGDSWDDFMTLPEYEDLPEEEKVYDRNTSIETLKLILKLGFTINK